jgi:hypothetical protein
LIFLKKLALSKAFISSTTCLFKLVVVSVLFLLYFKTLYKNNLIHQLNNNIKALSINTNEFKILFLNDEDKSKKLNLDETFNDMLKNERIMLKADSFKKIEYIINNGYLSKEKNEELFNKLLIDYNI